MTIHHIETSASGYATRPATVLRLKEDVAHLIYGGAAHALAAQYEVACGEVCSRDHLTASLREAVRVLTVALGRVGTILAEDQATPEHGGTGGAVIPLPARA